MADTPCTYAEVLAYTRPGNRLSSTLDQSYELDVTLVLFNRAERAVTSFGAHAGSGPTTDV